MTCQTCQICNNQKQCNPMTWMTQLTFTFIGGFIQDGLGWHNLAIPLGTKKNKKQKVTWINDRLHDYGQKDEEEFTVCIPLMPHFLWLHAYKCKHKYLLPLNNCVNQASQSSLSAFVRWRLLKGFPSREKTGSPGQKLFVPGLSLPPM